jgi:Right handed beta helix region
LDGLLEREAMTHSFRLIVRSGLIGALAALVLLSEARAQSIGKTVASFGAIGNGVTDDTSAFNSCLDPASNPTGTCWVEGGKSYLVGNVVMKSGMRLQGMGFVDYPVRTTSPPPSNVGQVTTVRAVLKLKSTANFILDVRKLKGAGAVHGLFLDCNNPKKTSGISGGSFQLTVESVTIVQCDTGLGGTDKTGEAHIRNSSFGFNNNGVKFIVDSFISDSDFANNLGNGVYLSGGSNANVITNSRFEWNNGFGIESYGGAEVNSITNCFFDRNKSAGIRIYGGIGFTISNSIFQGNASAASDWENAQIVINQSQNVSVTGGVSIALAGNDTSTVVPKYVVAFSEYAEASMNVVLSGIMTSGLYNASSNAKGGFTASAIKLGVAPTSLIIKGVLGAADQ